MNTVNPNNFSALSDSEIYANREQMNRELLKRKCHQRNRSQVVTTLAYALARGDIRSTHIPFKLSLKQSYAVIFKLYDASNGRIDVIFDAL